MNDWLAHVHPRQHDMCVEGSDEGMTSAAAADDDEEAESGYII